jgi:hypothetical protein
VRKLATKQIYHGHYQLSQSPFKSRLALKAKLRLKNFNVGVEAGAANKLILDAFENKISLTVDS